MVRIGGMVLALAMLMGCTGNIEALPGYIGIPGDRISTTHDEFTVHDRPGPGLMMVVASAESSMGEDFIQGRPIDTAGPGTPAAYFEEAARAYLDQTGRANCEIASTTKVINSQYEVAYDCPALPR